MSRPLDGITVLDFSRVLAAPLATQVLADLGADVIKVERPGSGDETRSFEPRLDASRGSESAYFFAFNRGKRSITLDLKSDAGHAAALALAAKADVVVENFVPGTMEKLGLAFADLSAINPQLVYVAASGFDRHGPERSRPGYDTIFQALSGVMHMTGEAEGPPAKAGVPLADLTSGFWIAIGALTGLVGRATHGHGAYVDITMMDVQVSLLALSAARVFTLDEDPHRNGTEHPGRVPSAAFECRDGWLHISGSDQHWEPLCRALGLDALADDKDLANNSGRLARRHEVMGILRDRLALLSRPDVAAKLTAARVPVGEVRTVREALDFARTGDTPMVGRFDHPTAGAFPALRTPIRFGGYDNPGFAPPPLLGAHTSEVLSTIETVTEASA